MHADRKTGAVDNGLFLFADIQEFYETTLMNEGKSTQQKTREAQQMSNKFQNQLSFYGQRTDAGAAAAANQVTSASNTNGGGGLISMDDLLASPALPKQPGFQKLHGNSLGDYDDFASVNGLKNARPLHASIPSQVTLPRFFRLIASFIN